GAALSDQAGDVLGAAVAGHHPKANFRQTEEGISACHAKGAGAGQFGAAAQGRAVNGGNGYTAKGTQAGKQAVHAANALLVAFVAQGQHFLQISTGTKALAAAGDNDGAGAVLLDIVEVSLQLADNGVIHGIAYI